MQASGTPFPSSDQSRPITAKMRGQILRAFQFAVIQRESPEIAASYSSELEGWCLQKLPLSRDPREALKGYVAGESMESAWANPGRDDWFEAYADDPEADPYNEACPAAARPEVGFMDFDAQNQHDIAVAVRRRREHWVAANGWPTDPVLRAMWRYDLSRREAEQLLAPVRLRKAKA